MTKKRRASETISQTATSTNPNTDRLFASGQSPIVPAPRLFADSTNANSPEDFLADANLVKTVVNTHDYSQRSIASSHDERATALAAVLVQIFDSKQRQKLANLVDKYYEHGNASLTPRRLIQPPVLSCLEKAVKMVESGSHDRARCLSEMILTETAKPAAIDASMNPERFMSIFTDEVIRLEYLGIIFAIAAFAQKMELNDSDRQQGFVSNMLYCSATCLRIARDVVTVNDMLLWLGHHYYILVAADKGHSSKCFRLKFG